MRQKKKIKLHFYIRDELNTSLVYAIYFYFAFLCDTTGIRFIIYIPGQSLGCSLLGDVHFNKLISLNSVKTYESL